MVEVILTIYSLEDTREVPLSGSRLSIGRSDIADLPINDEGLSRVHATIYREENRVWVLDKGSTNGTYVNNTPVPPAGLPIANGDEITVGNDTAIRVRIVEVVTASTQAGSTLSGSRVFSWPLITAAGGVAIVLVVAVVIASLVNKKETGTETILRTSPSLSEPQVKGESTGQSRVTSANTTNSEPSPSPTDAVTPAPETPALASAASLKLYASMSKEEQFNFVAREANVVARMIGNREGYALTPEVVRVIKNQVDAYAVRLNKGSSGNGGCSMSHNLPALLKRAKEHAPLVIKAFNEKGLSPQVGLYLAMIESEYCPCLSSGTGAKGMFQFVGTTARKYGVKDVSNPSTDRRWDDRCEVEIMAPIAAQYMKDLEAYFGTGPLSVPLAIASYNSGEGGLSNNLRITLSSLRGSERSFWSLVASADQLSSQFQRENIKYVPKFFGAAIIGENPRVFGVDMGPLSMP